MATVTSAFDSFQMPPGRIVQTPAPRRRMDPFVQRLASGKPWAMDPDAYRAMFELLEAHEPGAFLFEFLDEPTTPVVSLDVRSGVAVIPVKGPLVGGESFYSYFRGEVQGYSTIASLVRQADARPDVGAILLDVDSPGGEVVGVTEAADAVRQAQTPTTAFASYAASAGYWIAAQADSFVVERSAPVGSIGVVMRYSDFTAADEKRGWRFGQVVSSNAPAKRSRPVDDEVMANMQAEVDSVEGIFVADVARGRRASEAAVRTGFGRGAVKYGQDAVASRMADRVGSFEDVEAGLRESLTNL